MTTMAKNNQRLKTQTQYIQALAVIVAIVGAFLRCDNDLLSREVFSESSNTICMGVARALAAVASSFLLGGKNIEYMTTARVCQNLVTIIDEL